MSYKYLFAHLLLTVTVAICLFGLISQDKSYAMNSNITFEYADLLITDQNGKLTELQAEVALDIRQRMLGLSNRNDLPEDSGMIFLFPQEQHISMWMQNTLIPLDMAFINKDGIITEIITNAPPKSDIIFTSSQPTTAVLEIKGGYAEKYGINIGDHISWNEEYNQLASRK